MDNLFNGMFGKIGAGMCRLSMNGEIAVKTSNGYKTYNVKTGRLTNCNNFVFNIGEEFFFLIPTNSVKKGDIILISGKPKCVVEAGKDKITVINYEDSTVDTVLPERHVFMGNTYFYGKIVSLFGSNLKKGNGMNNIMKYMMMSELLKGNTAGASPSMGNALPFMMMMGGGAGNLFEDMFDFDTEEMFEGTTDDADEEDE